MNQRPILEVIVCSIEDAVAAERGGANRLEIISHYEDGGLTPSFDLVREIISTIKIPARVMLRESQPFIVADVAEIERLCETARAFSRLRLDRSSLDGLVLGFLKEGAIGKRIDHELVSRILACAPNLKATFHRAFEELPDPIAAIGELKRHPQIDCILSTNPGSQGGSWAASLDRFVEGERAAQPDMRMVLGGGVDEKTVEAFCNSSSIRAFHLGRAVREQKSIVGAVLEERVKAIEILVRRRGPKLS